MPMIGDRFIKACSVRPSILFLIGGGALILIGGLFLYFADKETDRLSEMPAAMEPVAEEPAPPDFQIELAVTEAARIQGLSGRSEVPPDYGMLFVFPSSARQGFWMQDMLVPIDIIWLSDTGVIIGIEEGVSPDTFPNVFYSPKPVRYVLETAAGVSAQMEWAVGTDISPILPL